MLWTGLGIGAGLVAGFILSEWVGDVNRGRVSGRPAGSAKAAPARLTTSATARSVGRRSRRSHASPAWRSRSLAMARGVVELRGWVPTRAARAIAGRTALAAPGIESVINSLLVRGEDDLARTEGSRATDQSA